VQRQSSTCHAKPLSRPYEVDIQSRYSGSSWLGEKDKYTESAFGLIDTIITNALPADVGFRAEPGAIWDKPAMDGMGLPHFPSIEWEALARLFERPYF
jgi:hypothetical protein